MLKVETVDANSSSRYHKVEEQVETGLNIYQNMIGSDSAIHPTMCTEITKVDLNSVNVEQQREENKANLEKLGGAAGLMMKLGSNLSTGLTHSQVIYLRETFGNNQFPESPMSSYLELLFGALQDPTLLILLAAATVSLGIGAYQEPDHGWLDGVAIFIAVFLVSNISAGNDYSKQLQFKALEATAAKDERTSVLREGTVERINPMDIVVGDILVLQAGDSIPADCVIVDELTSLKVNESSLTGEPDDLKKDSKKDPFLLSSCLVVEGEEAHVMVICVGASSQWGKIKANLVTESVNTPLQDKLEEMTNLVGYIGMVAAVGTFIALIVSIWARWEGDLPVPDKVIIKGFIDAFILAVTIVVVAIPEGLPLAVTISLAYSTSKMYQDQCFIRVLAACETMGNATNICSDKTGTLTENRMTVVEGFFANQKVDQASFPEFGSKLSDKAKSFIVEQSCVNRTAYLVYKDAEGKPLHQPQIIGNKTEGALINMVKPWGFDYEVMWKSMFRAERSDKTFSFNSEKKRSTTILHMDDGSVRVYCKGATEWILKDCVSVLNADGGASLLDTNKIKEIEDHIEMMASRALRTLCLAHKDYPSVSAMPANYLESPPDNTNLILDCIVGIIDPLRGDVIEAVRIAQGAGVKVRMVTGDNITTAKAIARQCGILTDDGIAVEGPTFRKMSPAELDKILPKIQVMGRSSPDDKYLMVTRLNGHGVPDGKEAWEKKFAPLLSEGVTWETHKDLLLPGYKEEWELTRPEGGDVVGVTGDGTNDAPALKAADVGLAMGITGTKVAQGASDIVILDDKFSSIVKAIMWGRSVYDNIRKFLQFQLTVNATALALVFIGAVVGFGEPLNAVQMLWVNLVMDTLGALALGTEAPTPDLLRRRPYKRQSSLLSWPMRRNILLTALYELMILLLLLFVGADLYGVHYGESCLKYDDSAKGNQMWNPHTRKITSDDTVGEINCKTFREVCPSRDRDCYENTVHTSSSGISYRFYKLRDYEEDCLNCVVTDYTHGSILFNAFIFMQFFNQYVSRRLFSELNFFSGLFDNFMFFYVSVFVLGAQVILIEFAGDYLKTSPLNWQQWLTTIALGFGVVPCGIIWRTVFAMPEDPNSFFSDAMEVAVAREVREKKKSDDEKKSLDVV